MYTTICIFRQGQYRSGTVDRQIQCHFSIRFFCKYVFFYLKLFVIVALNQQERSGGAIGVLCYSNITYLSKKERIKELNYIFYSESRYTNILCDIHIIYFILNYSIKEDFIHLLRIIKTIYKNVKGRHTHNTHTTQQTHKRTD